MYGGTKMWGGAKVWVRAKMQGWAREKERDSNRDI